MESLETRLARVEGMMSATLARLGEEAGKAPTPAPAPPRKGVLDVVQAFGPIVSGLLVALVAYVLTGSVTQILEERRVELSFGQAMQPLLVKLRDSKADRIEAEATALTLAVAFGKDAALPLLSELQTGTEVSVPAAEKALQALGLNHRQPTCDVLARAVGNRTRLFSWTTQRTAARLLADLDCQHAVPTLAAYRAFLVSLAAQPPERALEEYRQAVRDEPPVSIGTLAELRAAIDQALRLLDRQRATRPSG